MVSTAAVSDGRQDASLREPFKNFLLLKTAPTAMGVDM